MKKPNLTVSLLVFGDVGAEFIVGQTTSELTEDYITIIGNYYAAILGAASENQGLFGPLPVAHYHHFLVLIYGFNAKDSTVKDPRAVANNYIVPAFLLLFIPTHKDELWSVNRKFIKDYLDQWTAKYSSQEIRKTKIDDIQVMFEELVSNVHLRYEQRKQKIHQKQEYSRYIGKWFSLIEKTTRLRETPLTTCFVVRKNHDLTDLLQRAIYFGNYETLTQFYLENKSPFQAIFQLSKLTVVVHAAEAESLENNFLLEHNGNGLFYNTKVDHTDSISLIEQDIDFLLANTSNECFFSIILEVENDVGFKIASTSIPSTIANYRGRTINLALLDNKEITFEVAFSSFVGKLLDS